MQALCVTSEGMVVCDYAIVNAILSLMASYYVFNTAYQKGRAKNVFVFLNSRFTIWNSECISAHWV